MGRKRRRKRRRIKRSKLTVVKTMKAKGKSQGSKQQVPTIMITFSIILNQQLDMPISTGQMKSFKIKPQGSEISLH